ncbi:HET-domain-containing protein [Stipitochalara longipes BDJ]|nr:HET-domain-containing protein [Stipitochalara longipes BDJ]
MPTNYFDSTPPNEIGRRLSLTTPYTTLSHCWGGKMPFMLVTSNIHHLMDRIVVSELPITFQHAIAITKRLGIRYIWIDSLCIIQDSEDDWRRESSTMNQVYQFSYCNIAAAAASNSSEGCFFKRSPIAIEPLMLELDGDIPDLSPGHYFLRCTETWRQDLFNAPLSKRGWVVQERMLAQRVLYFTQRQIYFECRKSTLSEMNSFIPRSVSFFLARETFLEFDRKDKNIQRHANSWQIIVEYYAACALTREEDKLVAIAGVAKEVQRLTGWKYLAGIWEQNLIFDLLWFSIGGYNRFHEANPFLAPSWSWASARGQVTFTYYYLHGITIKDAIFIQIVEVYVSTKGGDETGQVTDGFLKVIGRPTPAELRRNHQPTRMPSPPSNHNLYIGGENTFIDFYPDDSTHDPPRNVWCLPVYWFYPSRSPSHLAGLILVKIEDTTNSSVFRRVGLFKAEPERMHYLQIPHGMSDSEYSDDSDGVLGSEIVPAANRHTSSTVINLPAEKLITII